MKGLRLWTCLSLAVVCLVSCRQAADTEQSVTVIRTASGMQMVRIPGGWFEMGSDTGEPDERPVHRVWIDSFYMDCFEVVQSEFHRHQISDPSHFKDPNHPLEQMNWTDATLYCNERSLAEGLQPCYDEKTWTCNFAANGYRLPTEAEWEYACRAGTSSVYSFGQGPMSLDDYGWFARNSGEHTHQVGQKKPNPWGLYDMYGNVAEWCQDYYAADYYARSPERNPQGPDTGTERVLRGGAWNSQPSACNSAYRNSDPSINDTCLANDTIGFRCVRRVR